ncbi:MAG TPA: GNAT family N-acetyltransferase, partial [Actinopolymorphaceae bacterium]
RWCGEAAALLRLGVPEPCAGLTPYDSHHFSRYLATAGMPALAHRTLFLRGMVDRERLLAAADWRLMGSVLYLNGLAVLPSARGHGVARELLTDGVRLARSLGCSVLELDVIAPDGARAGRRVHSAIGTFTRFGFEPVGTSTWLDVRETSAAEPGTPGRSGGGTRGGTPWRVGNWPEFYPHYQAYGFGELTFGRAGAGDEAHVVRRTTLQVLPGGWRVREVAEAPGLVRTFAPVIGHRPRRVFTVAVGTHTDASAFARFVRLRRLVTPA